MYPALPVTLDHCAVGADKLEYYSDSSGRARQPGEPGRDPEQSRAEPEQSQWQKQY